MISVAAGNPSSQGRSDNSPYPYHREPTVSIYWFVLSFIFINHYNCFYPFIFLGKGTFRS